MSSWQDCLKADPTQWLLEPENPSVRYFTLIEILDRSADDQEVVAARNDIMSIGGVPKLLEGLSEDGYWRAEDKYYLPRYLGTAWRFMLLAEFYDAINLLVKKQNKYGQWKQQHTFPKIKASGFMPIPIDPKGQPSKWVTARALLVLKRYYS